MEEHWTNAIGKHLIKSITMEIPGTFISNTQKYCKKCHKLFSYTSVLDLKINRLLSGVKNNINLCNNCCKN